jgi:hypothetical protein
MTKTLTEGYPMRIFAWAFGWMVFAVCLTGITSYLTYDFNLQIWQAHLRTASGIFFMIALIVGGVLTTDAAYRSRKRFFYRDEWSFICLLVTVGLFGLSLILS